MLLVNIVRALSFVRLLITVCTIMYMYIYIYIYIYYLKYHYYYHLLFVDIVHTFDEYPGLRQGRRRRRLAAGVPARIYMHICLTTHIHVYLLNNKAYFHVMFKHIVRALSARGSIPPRFSGSSMSVHEYIS